MGRVGSAMLLVALLAACAFDGAGVGPHERMRPRDSGPPSDTLVADRAAVRDGRRPDGERDGQQPPADLPLPADRALDQPLPLDLPPPPPDLPPPPPDLPPPPPPDLAPDQPPPPVPVGIGAAALGAALYATSVPCIKHDGQPGTPSPVRIVDTNTVAFYAGSVTLAGAGQATKSWVGSLPSVTVVFDPNACDNEGPAPADSSWSTAGLLVRGAELKQGRLWLQVGRTVADVDLLNVNTDGTFQSDPFGADDAQLATMPQLVGPIDAAKATIIELGYQ